jgi:hypothetical protein
MIVQESGISELEEEDSVNRGGRCKESLLGCDSGNYIAGSHRQYVCPQGTAVRVELVPFIATCTIHILEHGVAVWVLWMTYGSTT